MDIDFTLYPRVEMSGVGIAPLTSMFLFGPNDRQGVDDFREGVHDSDGLLMHTGADEWIWRPVVNPERARVSTFTDPGVRGFGLMQRERKFSDYQDLEARYERRPSAWVEPLGDWGAGQVVLLELDAPDETYDNLVAFWRPETPLAAGGETRLRYRLHWCLEAPIEGSRPMRAIATRAGSGASIGVDPEEDEHLGTRLFTVDFAGAELAGTRIGGRGGGRRERRLGDERDRGVQRAAAGVARQFPDPSGGGARRGAVRPRPRRSAAHRSRSAAS